jgi:hypothetical protein
MNDIQINPVQFFITILCVFLLGHGSGLRAKKLEVINKTGSKPAITD